MRRLALAGALCCGLSVVAAACSSSGGLASESPSQILSAVHQAVVSASSVRITGYATEGGKLTTADFTAYSNGNFTGTIGHNGATAQVVGIGGTVYLNASKSFYTEQRASAAAASLLGGKWVYGSNSQIGLGTTFTLSSLASQIAKSKGAVTKGTTGTVQGQAAVSLHNSEGTLWVATSGPAYPLEEVQTANGSGTVHFVAWNQGSPPTAPAGAQSLSSLESSLS